MKHHLYIASLLTLSLAGTAQATSSVVATVSNVQLSTTGTVTPVRASFPGGPGTGQAEVDSKTGKVIWAPRNFNSLVEQHAHDLAVIDEAAGLGSPWASAPAASITSGTTQSLAQMNPDLSLVASVSTGESGGYAEARVSFQLMFWLEAHSSLTATWDTSISGSNPGGNDALSYETHALSTAGGWTLRDSQEISAYPTNQTDRGAFSFEKASAGSLTFQTADRGDYFYLDLGAYAVTWDHLVADVTPPVPEPETWALALLGLALVGAKARQRR